MNFLQREFEKVIEPIIGDGTVSVGPHSYTAADILKLAGEIAYRQAFNYWIWNEWIPERRDRKDELLKLDSNRDRFEQLKRMIGNGGAVPFIGSGMSVPTGMPAWGDFLRKVRQRTKGFTASALSSCLTKGDFEIAASRIFSGMPTRLFNECFESHFRLLDQRPVQGAVQLIPRLFESCVITTNFDPVLEQVYGNEEKPFKEVLFGNRVEEFRKHQLDGTRVLLKLHGKFDNRTGRVLLKREYDDFYRPGSRGRKELALVFGRGGLLFLGCSLWQDRTMALLKEVSDLDDNTPRNFSFLKRPQQPGKQKDREHFLTERNIFPIWYDGDHNDDIEALLVGLMDDLRKF